MDIQREESLQAKRRAAQEAAVEADRAAAAASASTQAAGGWGKSVLRPSAPAGTAPFSDDSASKSWDARFFNLIYFLWG